MKHEGGDDKLNITVMKKKELTTLYLEIFKPKSYVVLQISIDLSIYLDAAACVPFHTNVFTEKQKSIFKLFPSNW